MGRALAKAMMIMSILSGLALGEPPDSEKPPSSFPREAGPPRVAWYAHPSNTPAYRGDYVGGGCPCLGGPRCPQEGTWGWDYEGCWLLPHHVFLNWCHGRYQGGQGAYKTDGPRLPPPPQVCAPIR